MVKNDSMKFGFTSVESHCFDTQRNLVIDLAGNLMSIMITRSNEIHSKFTSSSFLEVVENGGELHRRIFMADTLPLNPKVSIFLFFLR